MREDVSNLEAALNEANTMENKGKYLDAVKMYSNVTSLASNYDPSVPGVADLYLRAATGMARCANKDDQFDKAIDVLEKQLNTSNSSPAYMRDTLSYSYLSKAARCCSRQYKEGIGMPCSKQETANMESWVIPAENLNPQSDEMRDLLSRSRWAVDTAKKRIFFITNPVVFVFGILFIIIAGL